MKCEYLVSFSLLKLTECDSVQTNGKENVSVQVIQQFFPMPNQTPCAFVDVAHLQTLTPPAGDVAATVVVYHREYPPSWAVPTLQPNAAEVATVARQVQMT